MKTKEQIHAEFDEKFYEVVSEEPRIVKKYPREVLSFIDSIRLQDERDLIEEVVKDAYKLKEKTDFTTADQMWGYREACIDLITRLRERIGSLDNKEV